MSRYNRLEGRAVRACLLNQADELREVLAEARESLDSDKRHNFDCLVNNGPLFAVILDANAAACLQVLLDIDTIVDIINEDILEGMVGAFLDIEEVTDCFEVFVACPRIDPNPFVYQHFTEQKSCERTPRSNVLYVLNRLLVHPKIDNFDDADDEQG